MWRKTFHLPVFAIIPRFMRFFRIAFLAVILALAGTTGAWAHARLVRVEPKSGANVTPAPNQIDLWFNELLEDDFNTVTVFPAADLTAAKKTNFVQGKPTVDPHDRTHLIIKVTPMGTGEFIIEWRVLSRDGHSAPGRSKFTVRAS